MDLSKLSDKELEELEVNSRSAAVTKKSNPSDLSSLSDEELQSMLASSEPVENKDDILEGAKAFGSGFKRNLPFGDYLNNLYSGAKNLSFSSPEYIKERDLLNEEDERLKEENPVPYYGGAATSFLVPGKVLGLLGKGAQAANLSTKAKALSAAALGAGYGFLEDPGDVKGEVTPLQLGQRSVQAGVGAVVSPALAVGGEKIASKASGLLKSAASDLDETANKWAFSALRGYKKDVKKAFQKGEIEEIGKELFDSGILKGAPKSIETLAKETSSKEKELGKVYGNILNEISEKAGPVIDRRDITNKVREKLKIEDQSLPFASEINELVEKGLKPFEGSQRPLSISEAQDIKQKVSKLAKWDTNFQGQEVPDKIKVARELYHAINESIDQTADTLVDKLGVKATADNLKSIRKDIYKLKVANRIAEGRNLGEVSNRLLSLTDYMAGGGLAGAADNFAQGGLQGLAAGLVNKGIREYGSQLTAKGAKTASKGLLGLSDYFNSSKITPQQQIVIQGMLKRGLLKPEDIVNQEQESNRYPAQK